MAVLARLIYRIDRKIDKRINGRILPIIETYARWKISRIWKERLRHGPQTRRRVPVVVSLTSHPARFSCLSLTLKGLLLQSVMPERLVLWIAVEDVPSLPDEVLDLTNHGLEIRTCENLGSYNKLVPALRAFPDTPVVVCDDDTWYWPTWLETLCRGWAGAPNEIICLRAHAVRAEGERILPYASWEYETRKSKASARICPTGCGGVLFPPNVFDQRVFDRAVAQSLCPSADDIWFYWMAVLNGASFRRLPGRRYFVVWKGSQDVRLSERNTGSENLNDRQIRAMTRHFGLPWTRREG